ncbi:MAG: ATP-binding protein [Desulfobacterales bacterium]|nr:ATP-binding protein [Desulfobacterales bacterium]
MKKILAKTINVENSFYMARSLQSRDSGVPGLGLVYGPPGLGKTRTFISLTDMIAKEVGSHRRPVFIRALANDTPRSFLKNLVIELGVEPGYYAQDLYSQAETVLKEYPRLIVVDEIDRLISNWKAIETLRDLTDQTGSPIIMIGMGDCERKLARFAHLYYRMKAHILHFKPLTIEGVRNFVDQICEVDLDDSAISIIHEITGGRIGEIIPEILRSERISRTNDITTISLNHLERKVA